MDDSRFGSSRRAKNPNRNPSYPKSVRTQYEDDQEDEENVQGGEFEEEEEDVGMNDTYDDDDEEDDEDERDDDYGENGYHNRVPESGDSDRYRKKRRLDNLGSSRYEFAARAAKPAPAVLNSSGDWTEHATFALLEAWGDRFIQLGRKSLRSDDWHEVAEKVSEATKMEVTDARCRSRLDALKKRYKKEKAKLEKFGGSGSKWACFKKMDMLMASSPRQEHGLACGFDSGEYVFMNPNVYLNCANGFDEMRDSPSNSEWSGDGDSDGLPPRRSNFGGDDGGDSSFTLLADSIQKFGEIYEKMENSKRQQMMELEKMRMEFHRELELEKKHMLERAHTEIAKLQREDDEDTDDDASAENLSG